MPLAGTLSSRKRRRRAGGATDVYAQPGGARAERRLLSLDARGTQAGRFFVGRAGGEPGPQPDALVEARVGVSGPRRSFRRAATSSRPRRSRRTTRSRRWKSQASERLVASLRAAARRSAAGASACGPPPAARRCKRRFGPRSIAAPGDRHHPGHAAWLSRQEGTGRRRDRQRERRRARPARPLHQLSDRGVRKRRATSRAARPGAVSRTSCPRSRPSSASASAAW